MRQFLNYLGLVTISTFIILISCEKDKSNEPIKNTCNVSYPAEEIAWLKAAIDNVKHSEYSYYSMANYKGETVFYYGNCDPAGNSFSIIRNCNGDSLGATNELYDELTDITILWKHKESKCNFQN